MTEKNVRSPLEEQAARNALARERLLAEDALLGNPTFPAEIGRGSAVQPGSSEEKVRTQKREAAERIRKKRAADPAAAEAYRAKARADYAARMAADPEAFAEWRREKTYRYSEVRRRRKETDPAYVERLRSTARAAYLARKEKG